MFQPATSLWDKADPEIEHLSSVGHLSWAGTAHLAYPAMILSSYLYPHPWASVEQTKKGPGFTISLLYSTPLQGAPRPSVPRTGRFARWLCFLQAFFFK